MKRLWLMLSAVLALALLMGACKAQPSPFPPSPPPAPVAPQEGPRWFPENDPNFKRLTEADVKEATRIAIQHPRISEWLQGRADYRVSGIQWYAIVWSDSQPGTWWALDYEETLANGAPFYVAKGVKWYPGITIAIGEGTIMQAQIAVDLAAGKTVMVEGPYPSLNSPDRFKSTSPPK